MTKSRALTDEALIAILRKEEAAASANWTGALSKGYDQATKTGPDLAEWRPALRITADVRMASQRVS